MPKAMCQLFWAKKAILKAMASVYQPISKHLCDFLRRVFKHTRLEPMRLKQSLFVRCIVGVARNSLLFVVLPPYSEAKIQKFQVK
ncbi:MAG: hypothetical protein RR716_03795, partial [Christensenellaceae bacterium]